MKMQTLTKAFHKAVQYKKPSSLQANICLGVCRSGTTALAQVYGKAGFASYYQPVKADFRLIYSNNTPINCMKIAALSTSGIFCKETLGPFFPFETEINFIDAYEALGINIHKSHFIIAFRDPSGVFASWLTQWSVTQSRADLFDVFIRAQTAMNKLEDILQQRSSKISYYCHHLSQVGIQNFGRLFKSSTPTSVFRKSFLGDWQTTNLSRSLIIFPKEPAFFSRNEIHETTPYFYAPPGKYAAFTRAELKIMDRLSINESYQRRLSLALKQNSESDKV